MPCATTTHTPLALKHTLWADVRLRPTSRADPRSCRRSAAVQLKSTSTCAAISRRGCGWRVRPAYTTDVNPDVGEVTQGRTLLAVAHAPIVTSVRYLAHPGSAGVVRR